MEKEISKRKQKILQALVDEYVSSAQPVSSGDIREKYMPEISSATIRSELASLEELGYLSKPHTSAGRVPSPMAYKLYVDKLMPDVGLTAEEAEFIRSNFSKRIDSVESIISRTAKVISDITNYTSVIVVDNFADIMVKEIKLVPIGDDSALVIIITDQGVLKDKTIDIPSDIKGDLVVIANNLVNKVFAGKRVAEILEPFEIIEEEIEKYRELFEEIIEVIVSYRDEGSKKVYMEGALKMLDYPEYNNIDDAKNFLSVINDKENVASLLETGDNIEFSVKIGKDESGGIDKCAVVTAKYTLNGREIGKAGVIGPERMDYNKVKSVLNYIGKAINGIIDEDE